MPIFKERKVILKNAKDLKKAKRIKGLSTFKEV